jgi:hypothetical protein
VKIYEKENKGYDNLYGGLPDDGYSLPHRMDDSERLLEQGEAI